MANFCAIRGEKASILEGHDLLFVHCVSKKPLILIPDGLPCVQLECRELHVSFLDSLDIRRIALCPSLVKGIKIEELFAECDSPALVEMHSSCVFKFCDPNDHRDGGGRLFNNVILWEFDILPSPTSPAIPPRDPDKADDDLDNVLPPMDLLQHADCNCFNLPTNPVCLVGLRTHRMLQDENEMVIVDDGEGTRGAATMENEMEEIQQLTEMLDVEDAAQEESLNDPSDNNGENTGNDVMYPEKFVVVGSWQEQRYQAGLAICMWKRSSNQELVFKVEHEPDNVRDKNALKFLVSHNDEWHIIGYCGVNKIPKLKSALHRNEVYSISLDSLKRTYAYREKQLLYSASLLIVKQHPWDKDDPRNTYNSHIDF